jgi:hypothetical protein
MSEERQLDSPTRISPVRIPGMPQPGATSNETTPPGICAGCGARLLGRFCASCGQRAGTRVLSLRMLLSDYLDDQFSLNTTLPRTLGSLFFKPGHLTREFLRERVSPYVPPFRLYLVTSLIFFLLVSLRAEPGTLDVSDRAELDSVRAEIQDSIAARTARGEELGERVGVFFDPTQENWADSVSVNLGNDALNRLVKARLQALGRLPPDEAMQRVMDGFVATTPKVMFFLLPFYAFLLKLLYIRSKRFYVEHFVFSLHGHAFAFSLFVVLMLAALAPGEGLGDWMGLLIGVSLLWLMVYYWVALKRVYQQGWFKTTVKWLLLGQLYTMAVGLGMVVAILAAVFTV